MGLYNPIQFQWSDHTGEHLFVSDYPYAFQSAMTLAIALHNDVSVSFIRITECETVEKGYDAGIKYTIRYEWKR